MEKELFDEPTQQSGYRSICRIGANPLVEVLLALRLSGGDDELVVVKRVRGGHREDLVLVKRLLGEARAALPLRHEHIVAVREVEVGGMSIVSEYEPADSLLAMPRRQVPVAVGVAIASQVAAALEHAHGHEHHSPIPHQALSPVSVLLTDDGSVKLDDFGAMRVVATHPGGGELARQVMRYVAPEACAQDAAEPTADLYALGAVLYELLTGETFSRRAQLRPSLRNGEVPTALDLLVAQLLSEVPEQRPPAGEALELLRRLPLASSEQLARWVSESSTQRKQRLALERRARELARARGSAPTRLPGGATDGTRPLGAATALAERRPPMLTPDPPILPVAMATRPAATAKVTPLGATPPNAPGAHAAIPIALAEGERATASGRARGTAPRAAQGADWSVRYPDMDAPPPRRRRTADDTLDPLDELIRESAALIEGDVDIDVVAAPDFERDAAPRRRTSADTGLKSAHSLSGPILAPPRRSWAPAAVAGFTAVALAGVALWSFSVKQESSALAVPSGSGDGAAASGATMTATRAAGSSSGERTDGDARAAGDHDDAHAGGAGDLTVAPPDELPARSSRKVSRDRLDEAPRSGAVSPTRDATRENVKGEDLSVETQAETQAGTQAEMRSTAEAQRDDLEAATAPPRRAPERETEPVGAPGAAPVAAEPPKRAPRVVGADEMKRKSGETPTLRISGLDGPVTPSSTRSIRVQICANAEGQVTSVTAKVPAEVLASLRSSISRWTYAPHLERGEAVPVCFVDSIKMQLER